MSSFFVYKRGKYYYARLKNPLSGQWTVAKSTHQTNRNEAIYFAMGWLHNSKQGNNQFEERSSDDFFQVDSLLHQIKQSPY